MEVHKIYTRYRNSHVVRIISPCTLRRHFASLLEALSSVVMATPASQGERRDPDDFSESLFVALFCSSDAAQVASDNIERVRDACAMVMARGVPFPPSSSTNEDRDEDRELTQAGVQWRRLKLAAKILLRAGSKCQ